MSIQKPVAWCREPDKYGRRKLSFEKPTRTTASTWHPLYALPGAQAQPAPSISPAALRPVIQWLRNGCDPVNAADELELLAAAPEAKP